MTAAAAPKSVGAPHRASWRTPTPAGHRPKSHVYAAHEGTRTRRSIDHSLIAPNRAMNSSRVGHMTEFGRSPSHSRLSARITAVSPGRISSISFHSKCGNARLPYPPAPTTPSPGPPGLRLRRHPFLPRRQPGPGGGRRNRSEVLSRMTDLELAGPVERVHSTPMRGGPRESLAVGFVDGFRVARSSGNLGAD
jgi:hypothetical protein